MSDTAPAAAVDWPQCFVDHLRARFGDAVDAIVLYGSWLRGKRDTVLDFYVLLDDYAALDHCVAALANRLLPPNVYHVILEQDGAQCAAKFATVTSRDFERAIERDFHSYFWARFAQPASVRYARDSVLRARLERSFESAARRMITATAPLLPSTFSTTELWSRAFTLTYECELRSEDAVGAAALAETYAAHLRDLTAAVAADSGLARAGNGRWAVTLPRSTRRRADGAWRQRRHLGKLLSVARLLKAAFTFNDPLGYVVWKVARHSGVVVDPTPLQRRHPLLFGWPVLWRLYRRGGFR